MNHHLPHFDMNTHNPALFTSLLFFIPLGVFAHATPGGSGFYTGLEHPIGGLDHVLAMVAVGIWAAQAGGKSTWILSGTFLGTMFIGGVLGAMGVPLPLVEPGIVASILLAGILVLGAFRLPLTGGCILIGVLAIFHGHAHGTEMPDLMNLLVYAAGFAITTALLLLNGILFGIWMRKLNLELLPRIAGGLIALGGIALLVG